VAEAERPEGRSLEIILRLKSQIVRAPSSFSFFTPSKKEAPVNSLELDRTSCAYRERKSTKRHSHSEFWGAARVVFPEHLKCEVPWPRSSLTCLRHSPAKPSVFRYPALHFGSWS